MKKLIPLLAFVLVSTAMAENQAFSGEGIWRQPSTKQEGERYTNKLSIKEITQHKEIEVTETWTLKSGESQTVVSRVHFNEDNTLRISRDGVTIGHGYFFETGKEGYWTDYRMQSPQGEVHVNQYYDAETKSLYRLGDVALENGPGHFMEVLSLDKAE